MDGYPRAMTWRGRALVFLLFVLLTALATWPLARRPARELLGTPGDSLLWAWNFSWTRDSLLHDHRLPFFSEHTFRPFPLAMLHHTHTFFYGFLYTLGGFLYENPWFWSNLFIFTSFVIAGCGAFALARMLCGHTPGALLAGAVYAYCSLRLSRVTGHLNILSGELIPWYLYLLIRGTREARAKWFLLAGLCFAATTWNDYYNSLFIIMFTGLFIALAWPLGLARGTAPGRLARATGPGLILAGALLFPFAWGLWQTVTTRPVIPEEGALRYCVGLTNYLAPSPNHRLLARWLAPYYERTLPGGNPVESTVFFGYTAIILALYGLLNIRPRPREQKFFALCGAVFLVLSLGPVLRVPLPSHFLEIPLPYRLLQSVPFLADFRVPSRFGAMVALCAAVLAAYGLRAAMARAAWSARGTAALTAGLLALVLAENLHAPYPNHYDVWNPAVIPHRLLWKIRTDPVPGVVLKVPPSHWDWTAIWMQTLHHKPSVTGVLARWLPSQLDYYQNLDVSGWFRPDPRQPAARAPEPWTPEQVSRFCYFFDLRHVLLTPFPGASDFTGRLRREILPLQGGFGENQAWLGVLEKQPERFPIEIDGGAVAANCYFTAGFTQPLAGSRWLSGTRGQVAFRLDAPRDLKLKVELGYPFHMEPGVQGLKLKINGKVVSDRKLDPGWSWQEAVLRGEMVRAGYNFIDFEAGQARPPRPAGTNPDVRPLALMVRKIVIGGGGAGARQR